MSDSQTDVSELAREVVAELEDTRQVGDQLLLSRREAIALSTGAVSLGALGVAGAGSASAQEAAGQIGTASDPVDVEGAQGNFSQGVSVDGALEADAVSAESLSTELDDGSDVTSSRSFDTIYENTQGHDIQVFLFSGEIGSGEIADIRAQVAETPSAVDNLRSWVAREQADGDTAKNRVATRFRVPDGYHYRVENRGDLNDDDVTIWSERGVTANV